MVCKYCGSYMPDGTIRCSRCGRNNEADAFSPVYKSPDSGKPSPFMSSPSLGGEEPKRPYPGAESRLIGMEKRGGTPKSEPPKPLTPPSFTPTPAPFTPTPATPRFEPPRPAPAPRPVPRPVRVPPVAPPPMKKSKKKKKTGKRIAGILVLCLFFVCVLGVFKMFSDTQEYALHWGEKTDTVNKYMRDKNKMNGFCREHYDAAKVKKDPETNKPKFKTFIDETDPKVMLFTRYFCVPKVGNTTMQTELACYFEDRLLSGIEMYCEDGMALRNFFCDEFNVLPSDIDGITEIQYKTTRIVYFPDHNRIFFADMEGEECIAFLDSYLEENKTQR